MTTSNQRELLRGLLDHVELCLERGRLHAAEEALIDAKRLDAAMGDVADERDLQRAA